MATAVTMIGGAVVNALAFSGSNYLFSQVSENNKHEALIEQKRHELAMEKLTKARDEWNKKRTELNDFLSKKLYDQKESEDVFNEVDEAMEEYGKVYGEDKSNELKNLLGPEPKLSDFYVKSDKQEINEIIFITVGMSVIVGVIYIYKNNKGKK